MTQEMSNAEQESLQALVHRIATHIVEGSAAVQELKSTVARLKNERSDIEYVVYKHWLKAAKIIEAAGKEKSSWERFMESLQLSYGDTRAIIAPLGLCPTSFAPPSDERVEKEDHHLLPIASKELWAHKAPQNNNVGTDTTTNHRFVETSGGTKKQNAGKKKLNLTSGRIGVVHDIERLTQVAMTIGEPNSKMHKGVKRKLEESRSKLVVNEGGGGKKRSFIQFTNGRKISGEKVLALKKDGRCFYCERKGHCAIECKDNPDIQGIKP